MLRTEEEAKKCWCPFARYTSVRGQGINRWVDDGDQASNPMPARCIASECMAWRWQMVETEASKRGRGIGIYPPPARDYEQTERGFCGLAGSPS